MKLRSPWRLTKKRLSAYLWILALVWTACVFFSLFGSVLALQATAVALAKGELSSLHVKEILYKEWNALHRERTLAADSGAESEVLLKEIQSGQMEKPAQLSAPINPSYLPRKIQEFKAQRLGPKGRIVSLRAQEATNKPDSWELLALRAFEQGEEEVSACERMNGEEYLRLMQPIYIEQACLVCHEQRGYKAGEICGAISVSTPITITRRILQRETLHLAGIDLVLGAFGLILIYKGGRILRRHLDAREEDEKRLRSVHKSLEGELEERKRIEGHLLRIQAAVDDASDAVAILERDASLLYINMAFGNLFGHTVESLEPKGLFSIFEEPEQAQTLFYEALQGNSQSLEVALHDGKERVFSALVRVSSILDDHYEIHGVLFMVTDITERKRLEEELRKIASQDGLTQAPNRRTFDAYLEKEWRRAMRSRAPLSLIMIDLDYFKKYNDTYGHQAGDDCLKAVAGALGGVLKRPGDLVARYGGEEFVVVLPETDAAGGLEVAQVMCRAVEALHLAHEPSSVSSWVTLSVGLATVIPVQGQEEAQLIALADAALYKAKEAGRNQVAVSK